MNIQRILFSAMAMIALSACGRPPESAEPVDADLIDVRIDTEEADAALAILDRRRVGETIGAEDWGKLFSTDGYRRLKRREHAMGRAFEDTTFQAFLLEDSVAARTEALSAAIADWQRVDVSQTARRPLAYLPAGTHLRATLYPVIKPQTNSFVFEVESDPAIFMYLDTELSREKLENIVAHELHHIGYAAACADEDSTLSERVQEVVRWAGAFGEGFAMVAAAGGSDVHPHATSDAEERARWDRDVTNVDADLRRVEAFFFDLLDGRLADPDSIRSTAMSFFGVQGPWYTVGWKMAVTIEEAYGRTGLVEVICDPRQFLARYNAAAAEKNESGENLPLWSASLLERIGAESPD